MKLTALLFFLSISVFVNGQTAADTSQSTVVVAPVNHYFSKQRTAAITLILLTGPIGGHRIYLGTHPRVPILYAITLGGGLGLLPLIDLVLVLLRKDLSPYLENQHVFLFNPK